MGIARGSPRGGESRPSPRLTLGDDSRGDHVGRCRRRWSEARQPGAGDHVGARHAWVSRIRTNVHDVDLRHHFGLPVEPLLDRWATREHGSCGLVSTVGPDREANGAQCAPCGRMAPTSRIGAMPPAVSLGRPVAGSTHDRVHRLCHGVHLAWSVPVLGTSLRRTLTDQLWPAARPGRATRPRSEGRSATSWGDSTGR